MSLIKDAFDKIYKATLIALFVIVCIGFSMVFNGDNIFPNKNSDLISPYSFHGPIELVLDNGMVHKKEAPFVIKTDKSFYLNLYLDNIGMIDNKSLSLITRNTNIRCEVDEKVIYRHSGTISKYKYAQNNSLLIIDLPKTINNNKITLYYENNKDYPTEFEVKNIRIGKRINIISNYFLKDSFFEYLLIILMITIIISVFSTTNIFKKQTNIEKYFIHTAFLSFYLSIYIVCSMPLSYFIADNYSPLLSILTYSSLMFIPLHLLSAIALKSSYKSKSQLKFAVFFVSINIIAQFIIVFLDVQSFAALASYTYLFIVYAILLSIYSIGLIENTHENRAMLMKLSLVPVIIGLSYEVILNILNGYIGFSVFFKICIFIFIILQCYDFFNFYITNRNKKIQAELYAKLALIDRLTRVGNRLSLSEQRVEYDRTKGEFFIVLMDINNLKYINDNYGHKYGDDIIKLLPKVLKNEFSDYDKDIFRIGGDEFVMVYHAPQDIDLDSKILNFTKIYENSEIEGISNGEFGVSCGYSYCSIKNGDDFGKKMHIADKHMYQNKLDTKENMKNLAR